MAVAKWKVGQSGNPDGRPRRGRTIGALARAIGRERVEFTDREPVEQEGNGAPGAETAAYTRIERMVRVFWTMALEGDRGAANFLAEYTEGKPARQAPRTEKKQDGACLSADDFAEQLRRVAEEEEQCSGEGKQPPKSEKRS